MTSGLYYKLPYISATIIAVVFVIDLFILLRVSPGISWQIIMADILIVLLFFTCFVPLIHLQLTSENYDVWNSWIYVFGVLVGVWGASSRILDAISSHAYPRLASTSQALTVVALTVLVLNSILYEYRASGLGGAYLKVDDPEEPESCPEYQPIPDSQNPSGNPPINLKPVYYDPSSDFPPAFHMTPPQGQGYSGYASPDQPITYLRNP